MPARRIAARIGRALAAGALGAIATALLVGCAWSAPRWHGPPTEHFDGERFHNVPPTEGRGAGDLVKWMATRDATPWPEWIDEPPGAVRELRVAPGTMRVTFVGHASVLVQVDGVNVLTDPVWSERVGPEAWLGPRRHRAPGVRFADLPPIDVVLLSHDHYDHLDVPTLERLASGHHPRILTGLGNRALLEARGIGGSSELDWWQSIEVAPGVTVTCVPAQHFSMRGLLDRDATLWAGFVVTTRSGSFFFAGDTGYGPHFAEIRRRLGAPRLALLPIGAYRPRWFMQPVHMDPADAVRAHRDLGAGASVGVHWGTFQQTDEGMNEPKEDLARALDTVGESRDRFVTLGFGESRDVAAAP